MSEYHTFVSYAREDDSDNYIKKFVTELENTLKTLTNWDTRYINFFDAKSVNPGVEWPGALLNALQYARTLICIYTPRYFKSVYCGKEFSVFRSRIDAHMGAAAEGEPRPPVIIPILWVPERDILRWLPKGISDIQYKHADFGVKYHEHGVRTLSKLNRHRDAYQDFLNGLARRLVHAAEQYRLKPAAELPSIHTAPNAFEDPREETSSPLQLVEPPRADEETAGPRFVQFIFVAGSRDELSKVRKSINYYGRRGDEWQPYLPEVEEQIIFLTGDVVWREKLIPRIVELDQHIERRLEEAENENNIVVIVVDTWTLQLEQYSGFMRKYDRREFVNCVVMVPWNQNDSEAEESREALKGVIYSTFERKAVNKHPYTFYEWVSSPDALKRDLSVALNKARARIIEKSKRRKKAERQGVFIGKPIVEGPGRTRDAG